MRIQDKLFQQNLDQIRGKCVWNEIILKVSTIGEMQQGQTGMVGNIAFSCFSKIFFKMCLFMSFGEEKKALNRLGKYSSRLPKLTKENKEKKMTS